MFAQLSPNGNSGSFTTAYTNGSPNDPIYIWCATGLTNNTASLTATPVSGTGPWTFNWFYHNQTNSSWTAYSTYSGATSTISNLPSDGYRVQIYDNGGVLVGCYTSWVWNMNGEVTASQSPIACNGSNLTGTVAANGSFTYYNPPPPESLISASTQINVCFSATHTYVSDLAFYLVGPVSCGSPTILLSPNPGANGQGSICNSNNNVSNLCFTNAASPNFNPCNENCCGFLCFDITGCASNYSGTYDSYGPTSTLINWSALYGCNAAQGGWRVQIYDCIAEDVGSLTNATVSFSNLTSVCGSATSLSYTSGAINSAINDNSCSAATASVFQVPVSTTLSTPITINASTSYLWTASPATTIPNATTSLVPAVINIPNGTTTFTLTATISYGGTSCTYDAQTAFVNTCCAAVANAGSDVSFCTSGNSQIGTTTVANMSYSWNPTTGLNDATLAQPTVSLTNLTGAPITTTYTLTVTDVLNGGCTATDDVNVTVNPIPVVNAGTDQLVCEGASVTLAGGGASTYTWSNGVTNNVSFTQVVGTVTYTVTGTSASGCINTDQVNVTVNAPPIVSAGTYGPVCSGSANIALAGTPTGGTFSGTGVTGSSFNPASGTQSITYSYTDANSCSNSANTTITVNNLPSVDAGSHLSLCSGSSVTLNGSGSGTPIWSPPIGLSSTTIMNPTATPTSTTTYTLTIDDGLCISSDLMTITVANSPNLVITPNTTICEGDCITLDVSGADFYSWIPEVGITNLSQSSQNVCPLSTTTYNVNGYVVGGSAMTNGDFEAGATGFTSDYTLNSDTQSESTYFVTTNANLTHPGFTGVDHTTGAGNFLVVNGSSTPNSSVWCQTVTVQPNTDYVFSTWVSTLAVGSPAILQFSINGTDLSTPFTAPAGTGSWIEFYTTWNSGSATSASICVNNQNTSLGGNDFGLDDISFSAVCSSTSSVTVTVSPMADATITPVGPFCVNDGVVTIASAQSGGTWSGTGITNATNGTFNPSIAGPGTHSITYSILGSCGDTDVIQIVVNDLPTIGAGIDQSVCTGEQVTLMGSGATTLVWSNGVTDGIAFTPTNTTTYTLTGTDANGCSNSDQVTITVNTLPTIVGGADQSVCIGSNMTLFGSGGVSYTWDNGGIDGQAFLPPLGSTIFTVTGTDGNGCVNTDQVVVTALSYPTSNLSADVYTGYPNLAVDFENTSTNANAYVWNFGNGTNANSFDLSGQSFSYTQPGTYQVVLISTNGICSDSDTLTIIVIPFPDPILHVPNVFTPNNDGANDYFFIDNQYVSNITIVVLNRWGNVVFETEDLLGKWDGQFEGKDATDGVYFFKYIATGINEKVVEGHGNITLIR